MQALTAFFLPDPTSTHFYIFSNGLNTDIQQQKNKDNSCLDISKHNIFHNKNKASYCTYSHKSSLHTYIQTI